MFGSSVWAARAICPEVIHRMSNSTAGSRNHLDCSSDAQVGHCNDKMERQNVLADFKKVTFQEGIDAVGRRDFESLVKECGECVAKDYCRRMSGDYMNRAIVKYKKSREYQEAIQKAKQQQNAKDREEAQKRTFSQDHLPAQEGDEVSEAV